MLIDLYLVQSHLLIEVEVVDDFREVVDIVLVVHLCKLLKHYKLVDAGVDLLTTSLFKLNQFDPEILSPPYETLQTVVCLRNSLLVKSHPILGV